MIYLDNAATTRISPYVFEAMTPYLTEEYGNAGSIYGLGRRAAEAIAKARRQVADFIGAEPEQIIFTSGGTESNNLAILGCKNYLESKGKYKVITSPIEHDSVLKAFMALEDTTSPYIKDGFDTFYLDVYKDGCIDLDSLKEIIHDNEDIGIVSAMAVNNELGTVNPIVDIGDMCKSYDILFHTDCVQAAGTIPLDVNKFPCDLMSISSHKIHGPKGVGALFVRDRTVLSAVINGGTYQEFGLRGGTENVAGIVGFGMACEMASKGLNKYSKTVTHYKQCFYKKLIDDLKSKNNEACLSVNGISPKSTGKILSLTFDGVDSETLVLMVDARGVCVSAGSACQSHESHPSHVLKGIGMNDDKARCTIRISFSEFNTIKEIEDAAIILADCVSSLRGM